MWNNIGPRNRGGRIRTIVIHPNNPDFLYAGAESGGIWLTSNGGRSWKALMNGTENQNIGSFAVKFNADPANNVIYVGSGVPNSSALPPNPVNMFWGDGLYHSTNNGRTWTLQNGLRNQICSKVMVHPGNEAEVYVAGLTCFERSTDSGATWETLVNGIVSDAIMDPFNPQLMYVSMRNGFIKRVEITGSSEGAFTVTDLHNNLGVALVWGKLAIGKLNSAGSRQNSLLLVKTKDGQIYKSLGAGGSPTSGDWTIVPAPMGGISNGNTSTEIGPHNCLAIAPDNPDHVLAGGQVLSLTFTGFRDFVYVNIAPIHMDYHAISFSESNPNIVYIGQDGGVMRSNDRGRTWKEVNNGLVTMQFYLADNWAVNSNFMGAGSQDNGAWMTTGGLNWKQVSYTDAGLVKIHSSELRPVYIGEYSDIYKNVALDGRFENRSITHGIPTAVFPPWLFVMEMDRHNPTIIFSGGTAVYKSVNGADTPWQICSQDFGYAFFIRALKIAPSNSNIVYAGIGGYSPTSITTENGRNKIFRSHNAGNLSPSGSVVPWLNITGSNMPWNTPENRPVRCITVDRNNPNRVIVCFGGKKRIAGSGGHIFISENPIDFDPEGSTWAEWRDISTTLPNVGVNSLVIHPSQTNTFYIGTNEGVYISTDAGSSWTPMNERLPSRVYVSQLQIDEDLTQGPFLYAITYGRGAYKINLNSSFTHRPVHLYLRDHILDTGEITPSDTALPNPLDPRENLYWWNSPDIKIDSPHLTPLRYAVSEQLDGVEFETALEHKSVVRGTRNHLYIQLHNRGTELANSVTIRAFYCNATTRLPDFPLAAITAVDPRTVLDANWRYLGDIPQVNGIEPDVPKVITYPFDAAMDMPEHSCLVVFAYSSADPLAATLPDLGRLVQGSRQIAQKNLHVVTGETSRSSPMMLVMEGSSDEDEMGDLILDKILPQEGQLFLLTEKLNFKSQSKDNLQGIELISIKDQQKLKDFNFDPQDERLKKIWKQLDLTTVYAFKGEKAEIKNIILAKKHQLKLVFTYLNESEKKNDQPVQINLMQRVNGEIVGGSNFEIKPEKKSKGLKSVSRIRVTLESIFILKDFDPFFFGKGHFYFKASVNFNDDHYRTHQVQIPEYGQIQLDDEVKNNEIRLNQCVFDGLVGEDDFMKLRFLAMEHDLLTGSQALDRLKHTFYGFPETWVGSYELNSKSNEWKLIVSIESIEI